MNIQAVSALLHGDSLIHAQINEKWLAEGPRLSTFNVALVRPLGAPEDTMPPTWSVEDLTYQGKSLYNWISKESVKWVEWSKPNPGYFSVEYVFNEKTKFSIFDNLYKPIGLYFTFETRRHWRYFIVRGDASIGFYDYLEGRIVIPHGEHFVFALTPTEECFDEMPEGEHPNFLQMARPHTISMQMTTGLNPLPDRDTPDLDQRIERRLFNGLPAPI
jgi:hypothetical protein